MLHERQKIQNACYNTWNVHSSRKVKLAHGDKKKSSEFAWGKRKEMAGREIIKVYSKIFAGDKYVYWSWLSCCFHGWACLPKQTVHFNFVQVTV